MSSSFRIFLLKKSLTPHVNRLKLSEMRMKRLASGVAKLDKVRNDNIRPSLDVVI